MDALLPRSSPRAKLHPEIGSVRPWQHTADRIADLCARRVRGNAVPTLTRSAA